jgi:hypothetical protein
LTATSREKSEGPVKRAMYTEAVPPEPIFTRSS